MTTSCCTTNKHCAGGCSPSSKLHPRKPAEVGMRIALVGNPNGGKTTLFNALTGARQHVANWPGVTVERKSGFFSEADCLVEVVDLPGIYAMSLSLQQSAIDERIAAEFILAQQADLFVNIIDATHLERHLYLTLQLIEMRVPMMIALNMMDVAEKQCLKIDVDALSQALGCPVIPLAANKHQGLSALKKAILSFTDEAAQRITVQPIHLPYPEEIQQAVKELAAQMPAFAGMTGTDSKPFDDVINKSQDAANKLCDDSAYFHWCAIRLLEDDEFVRQKVTPALLESASLAQQKIAEEIHEDADILLAAARYQFIEQLTATCVQRDYHAKPTLTTRLDRIVLNRFVGIPIFFSMMYLLFVFAINIGGLFQDFFDGVSELLFVQGTATLLTQLHAPNWLIAILANGIGKGINTTVTFIPVIGAMFFFLAFLEDSGYMARAAFVVDRLMRAIGLPGKAFVPLIVGFGCNVPAVMAARTLENKRDRILTIMMSPFMSCGARLAIFAVFTTAFFPTGGQNIIFALYVIGVVMAILTGMMLRRTLLQGEASPFVMELPPYHVPHFTSLCLHAWHRLKRFITRAGKVIIPVCIVIGVLNVINVDGSMNTGDGDATSWLSMLGRWITPIFAPMGIHADNWPATVGLVTGVLAKEVVIGTLNTLYTQLGQFNLNHGIDAWQLWIGLKAAWQTIPDNLANLASAFSHPIFSQAPMQTVNDGVYGLMYAKFDGKIGAFAYLLFILLYFPCISTTAAMWRELHRGWSLFSIAWMSVVAYGAAVGFYQAATWVQHPLASSLWLGGLSAFFAGVMWLLKAMTNHVYLTTAFETGE